MTAVTRIHTDPDRTEPDDTDLDNADLARGDEDGPVVDLTRFRSAAHLTPEQVEALGEELDDLRRRTVADLGERDRDHIDGVVATQRRLELAGRALLFAGFLPPAWLAGTVALSLSKILDNMEIGHNVMHGQYDFLDREDYEGNRFEWDTACPAEQWRHTHNYEHHTFTNIIGKDRDVGYSVLRVSRDQPWEPRFLANVPMNALIAPFFEWAIAIYDLEIDEVKAGRKPKKALVDDLKAVGVKFARMIGKDYAGTPALAHLATRSGRQAMAGTFLANTIRNIWAHTVIFCGHLPSGVETFEVEAIDDETRGEWYVRQMLGSGNISGGPMMHLMTGNLSYQIEHHLYPDMSSNRLSEAAVRVREVCEKYDLPYVAGSLPVQYAKAWRTIAKMSLPNHMLRDTADDAPETHSERMFDGLPAPQPTEVNGTRAGLKTALQQQRARRRAGKQATAA